MQNEIFRFRGKGKNLQVRLKNAEKVAKICDFEKFVLNMKLSRKYNILKRKRKVKAGDIPSAKKYWLCLCIKEVLGATNFLQHTLHYLQRNH